MPKLFSVLCISMSLLYIIVSPALAQTSGGQSAEGTLGVARMIQSKDKNVKDGTILSTSEKEGAVLSNRAYDPHVIGVVSRDAAIILANSATQQGVPIISTGQVYVLVSALEGAIKKGDLLTTTSEVPGTAVKATKDGYVIGMALEDYASGNAKQVGQIAVDLDLHYFNSKPTFAGTLSDILKIALLPSKEAPTPFFKYLVAGGVVLASFVLTFMTFGRSAAKGVEALGRNPAASRIIHMGIIFNVGICVVITLVGLSVAFLILRL